MKRELRYCFQKSNSSEEVLKLLDSAEEQGRFLGFTYSAQWSHSCFTEEQRQGTEEIISSVEGCNYQTIYYLSGNLMEEDVDIKTFSQPLVQWCPVPQYSIKFEQIMPSEEPWGLSMEGDILFVRGMREFLDNILGLQLVAPNVSSRFDAYRIADECILEVGLAENEEEVLSVDLNGKAVSDVFRGSDNVLLVSKAFARVLKSQWDGFSYAKFQPVRCAGVSSEQAKHSKRKLAFDKGKPSGDAILADVVSIEAGFGIVFKDDFRNWLIETRGQLPAGWLSPLGGMNSEISSYASQEHDEVDPAMPKHLIPIYPYGDGSYICLDTREQEYVEWDHEDGTYTSLEEKSIQDVLDLVDF